MSAAPLIVSVLIAARNEEKTIPDCLRAIAHQNYPSESIEVLIGNDQSTDQTETLTEQFIANKPYFQLINITQTKADLIGKANVLAQLVQRARGQLLFFTDADTQVPPDWITEMSRQFSGKEKVGIVTGITLPEGPKLFHKLQTIDWLYNLSLTHLLSNTGISVTAMGNNMAVSRAAYDAVGDTNPCRSRWWKIIPCFGQLLRKNTVFETC